MKKTIALIIALLMVFSLFACAKKEETKQEEAKQEETKQEESIREVHDVGVKNELFCFFIPFMLL